MPQGGRKPLTAAAAAESPPPPPDLPKLLPARIHCGDAERAQVQAWDMNLVQAMHAWCQERLDSVVDGTTPEGKPYRQSWESCALPGALS